LIRTRRHTAAALTFVVLASLPSTALGQRAREEEDLRQETEALRQRGREVLHPGEPLQLVGIAEGAPGFLSSTPALADAAVGVAKVDRDLLRERKLALYEERARFDRRPTAASEGRGSDTSLPRTTTTESDRAEDGGGEPGPPLWPWLVAALSAAGFFALRRVRGVVRSR
jgi:hypothetical protein